MTYSDQAMVTVKLGSLGYLGTEILKERLVEMLSSPGVLRSCSKRKRSSKSLSPHFYEIVLKLLALGFT